MRLEIKPHPDGEGLWLYAVWIDGEFGPFVARGGHCNTERAARYEGREALRRCRMIEEEENNA